MKYRHCYEPIPLCLEATASIHRNVSRGYHEVNKNGSKKYVSYTMKELAQIHEFISPEKRKMAHMRWTKTHKWKDQEKAKRVKFIHHKTHRGLNTCPR